MLGYLLATLRNTLSPRFDLSKTRLETMAIFLFGLTNGRTVNLNYRFVLTKVPKVPQLLA